MTLDQERVLDDLLAAVRKHRDSWLNGDDACWKDNVELYQALPEGFVPPASNELVELENCKRYIASCHHPEVRYVSPQRRIEELEREVVRLTDLVNEADTQAQHALTECRALREGLRASEAKYQALRASVQATFPN